MYGCSLLTIGDEKKKNLLLLLLLLLFLLLYVSWPIRHQLIYHCSSKRLWINLKWTVHEKEKNIMEKTCRTDIAWVSFYGLSDYLISFLSILHSFVSIDWLLKHKKRKAANMKANIRHYVLWRPWSIMISKVNDDEWRWSKGTVHIRLWFEQNIFLDLTTCGTRIYTAWSLLNWRLPTTSLFFFIFYLQVV